MWKSLAEGIRQGDARALSRAISLVENEQEGYEEFLATLPMRSVSITGITGPPGAGKSTLADGLIELSVEKNEQVCVLCVDPSSALHGGALLGDRLRMQRWFGHRNVYIRSLSTRGFIGGLTASMVDITSLCRAYHFDRIIVETVGVGQTEIDIASLADTTVVVMVPEAGDDIQAMKSGLMEIGDLFVVNKSDRPGANELTRYLAEMLHGRPQPVPVIQTTASTGAGLLELQHAIDQHTRRHDRSTLQAILLQRALQLIVRSEMRRIDRRRIAEWLSQHQDDAGFNLHRLVLEFRRTEMIKKES